MERLSSIDEEESRLRMRLSSNPLVGIMVASLAAGPIAILLFLLGSTVYLIHDHARSSFIFYVWREYPYSSLPRGTLFGFVASMGPNAIGSWTLGMLGTVLPIARLWAFWPIAGGGIALFIPLLLEGRSVLYENCLYSAAIGAACAAICRFFTRWEPI
jgi:hypothetical protein